MAPSLECFVAFVPLRAVLDKKAQLCMYVHTCAMCAHDLSKSIAATRIQSASLFKVAKFIQDVNQ